MVECENVLFIYAKEKNFFFTETLNNGIKLFESFIPLSQTKLECYGTSSDVYIEYIDTSFLNDNVIKLRFYTYQTPCIEFVKKIAGRFNINVELFYYNEGGEFSGKIQIYRNQLVKNEKYSYWQGIYLNKRSEFWELIYPTFDTKLSFMEFLLQKNIHTLETDFNKLKLLYDEFLFCNLFKIL